jgi:hypothetical protein
MQYEDALALMVKRHADTNPNTGFRQQLRDYEA